MKRTAEMARVARGGAWSVAGTIAVQVLAFATTMITARALAPSDFGIAGMALVVVALVATVRDVGISPAIASGRIGDARTIATAHWVVCGAGAVTAGLVALLAPALAAFFKNDQVVPVLRVQALGILFASAVVVPQATLQRAGRYAVLAASSAAAQALVLCGTVVSLARGAGVWALVLPGVVASSAMVPVYWIVLGARPAFSFDANRVPALLREGLRVAANSALGFLSRNGDNAIVGRVSGERALGLYAFAYGFLMQPLAICSHALVPVLLPAFGRLEDPDRRSEATVRVLLTMLRLGAPVMIGGALTADLFIPVLFGPRWEVAVPLVQVLMAAGAMQIIGPVFGTYALALGDAALMLWWGAFVAAGSVATFLAGALLAGVRGVAVGVFLFTIVQVLGMFALWRVRYALPLTGLAAGLARIGRDLLLMATSVVAIREIGVRAGTAPSSLLPLEVLTGAVAYALATRLLAAREAALLVSVLPPPLARWGARLFRIDVAS